LHFIPSINLREIIDPVFTGLMKNKGPAVFAWGGGKHSDYALYQMISDGTSGRVF
jgi:hypothetical protein